MIIIKNINGIVFGRWIFDAENLLDAVKFWKTLPVGVTIEEYPTINFSNGAYDSMVSGTDLWDINTTDEMQKFIDAEMSRLENTFHLAMRSRVVSELFACKA